MRVAAIDCGTNAIRLLVADVRDDLLTDVVRRMEIVRLGEGVDRTGRLAPAAIERTRLVLADYAAQVRATGAERVRMVATSATRDAANAEEFHAMVLATLGVPPEVITGAEEARLSFTGAVRGLAAPGPYLVVDIGGGSTEFVTGDHVVGNATVDQVTSVDKEIGVGKAISVDIGCVRMTERHLPDDPPTPAQVAAAEADITAAVDHALAAVGAAPGERVAEFAARSRLRGSQAHSSRSLDSARTLVGLAGSVTTVAALAHGLEVYDPARIHQARVTRAEVAKVTADLLAATHAGRLASPVIHPGRADVIGAGALILRVIMERSGAPEVIASEHDILDGIAFGFGP
jgi:exopolyphosphatase/guanosine-5'-triphosphate,3'-diphosphate pyrophosphatase